MHGKCIEKCIWNALQHIHCTVFQPVGSAFQPSVIISKCTGKCSSRHWNMDEQCIVNFFDMLRVTINNKCII